MFTEVAIRMGYAELRTQAGGGYLALCQEKRCFVSLLTGSGKSLGHSWLPGVFDEVRRLQSLSFIYVVSPLAALMREHEL